ncbi:MAG TPA: DUF3997 domain-containing protein [Chryseosolibacter sp.]|nr:DUF3997 domain-containing protein [Chryseosolibacter sp.]
MKGRITSVILLWTTCLILTGCFGLFDSSSDTIIGRYKVLWIDLQEQQFICEELEEYSTSCLTLVPEYVFAVGHNDNFIIAKQHPTSGFEDGFKVDTSLTNYYIIDIKRKIKTDGEKVIGPLTKEQFDRKVKEFKIEEIKFEMTYPEVP